MRNNKKGFTLVELLAVIVILAVVMLIAVTSVGPMMEKSRKGALGTEGVSLVDAAKAAFNAEQMSNGNIKANSTVCFDMEWLKTNNYFEKGSAEGYNGSVLVYRNVSTFEYYFWLNNGTYQYGGSDSLWKGVDPNHYVADTDAKDAPATVPAAIKSCGTDTKYQKIVYCTGTACTAGTTTGDLPAKS